MTIENVTEEFLKVIKRPDSSSKKLRYLIVMPVQTAAFSQYQFPIGLSLVSSSLKASSREVFTLNLTYKENYRALLRQTILNNDIDVLCTGGLSGQWSKIDEIMRIAKETKPEIITIVGGGIITADPETAMKALESADYGVSGEGELVINSLAYALETDSDAAQVEGVISRSGCLTVMSHEIENLDYLPFPDYDGFELDEMLKRKISGIRTREQIGVPLMTSRSCPYNCTFCFHSSGNKYRKCSIDRVFKELDWLKSKYDFEWVMFSDELFGRDISYVKEFCHRLKQYNVKYWVQTRVDIVTEEFLWLLKESGCQNIFYGVEHIDERILKSMRKNITLPQIENAFELAKKVDLAAEGFIIFGDLKETAETIQNALNWCRTHSYNIRLNWILTFPGTHLYSEACKNGIIKDRVKFLKDGCPQINISGLSEEEYVSMQQEVSSFRMSNGQLENTGNYFKNISRLASERRVAVWPVVAGEALLVQRNFPELCKNPNVFFVNIDPEKHTLNLSDEGAKINIKISSPDLIRIENIDTVVCTRDDLYEQICKICENEFPSVREVLRISQID